MASNASTCQVSIMVFAYICVYLRISAYAHSVFVIRIYACVLLSIRAIHRTSHAYVCVCQTHELVQIVYARQFAYVFSMPAYVYGEFLHTHWCRHIRTYMCVCALCKNILCVCVRMKMAVAHRQWCRMYTHGSVTIRTIP
jgi:hypothetical protein